VAIQTERLFVTLGAVASVAASYCSVSARPVGIMIGRDAFAFVAFIAFGNLHFSVLFVGLLLGSRLLYAKDRHKEHYEQK
jgi:hypothetical protein